MSTRLALAVALAVAAAALLHGCSGSSTGPGGSAAKKAAIARNGAKPNEALVSAVPANKTPVLPLQVKFELHNRPSVGQPVEVDVVVQTTSALVDRLLGKVEGDDGLEIVEGAEIPPTLRPVEGVPLRHTVKLLPKHDGIFTFTAVMSVEAGGDSTSQTYAMPLIAGAGLPNPPVKAQQAGPTAAAATAAATTKAPTTTAAAH